MKRKTDSRILVSLFLSFLEIGAFTFGGGYAMIAILENEFVVKKKWLEKEEFLDMVAIAESTPGPVAVNSATYIGYRLSGVAGAAVATLAVVLPSFVIIYIISLFLERFLALRWVSYAFKGIQVCVVYLIFTAGLRLLKSIEKRKEGIFIFTVVLILTVVFYIFSISFSSIFFILLSGLLYVVLESIRRGWHR